MCAQQSTPSVFARPDEDDITHWSALIVGPPHSPYASGLFHFDLRFPEDYPNSAPRVLLLTTSAGSVRFNPNLYSSGMVCLSTLGTWRAEPGEQWSAVQNVMSVLLSIQSLMHDKPYHNEPGFELDDGSGNVERYNEKIAHESLRVAVGQVMEDTLDGGRAQRNGASPTFADLRKQLFTMQAANYVCKIETWMASDNVHVHDGKQFKMMRFEMEPNQMKGSFAWKALHERFVQLRARLDKEVETWRVLGREQAVLLKTMRVIGLMPAVSELVEQFSQLQTDGVDNILISDMEDNALVRELTLLGPEGTSWEGGCFQVELIFPPSWPDMCARTPISRPAARPARLRVPPPSRATLRVARRVASPRSASASPALTHECCPSPRHTQVATRALRDNSIPPKHQRGGRALPQHAAALARCQPAPAHGQVASKRHPRALHSRPRPRTDHAPQHGGCRALLLLTGGKEGVPQAGTEMRSAQH
jgi:ubiquitin-conjugating enzyme E2 Z